MVFSLSRILGKVVGSAVGETAEKVAGVVDRFVETPEERKAADAFLMKIQQEPDKWQAEINKIEAKHRTVFVAGWRPFIGWICGLGIGFHFIISPILAWGAAFSGKEISAPTIEVGALMTLALSLLGLSATRSYEKKHDLTK